MTLFQEVKNALKPSMDQEKKAKTLVETFLSRGFLSIMPKGLSELEDPVIASFFEILSSSSGLQDRSPASPVAAEAHSGWMNQRDFCFVNVKAAGTQPGVSGNFLQASKLLPGIRSSAVHLAPFLDCEFHVIYAIRSLKTIDRDVLHPVLSGAGISSFQQLQYFVEACHLLGKTVGFDLEPHASQFSVPVLERPEAFRWIKVYPQERKWLDYYLNPQTVYLKDNQNRLIKEVKSRVSWVLRQEKLTTFDETPGDSPEVFEKKMKAYEKAVLALIKEGYWTVPVHTWDAHGLPSFAGYNHEENYPVFEYRNTMGRDSNHYAYHIVTPIAFYNDLPLQGTAPYVRPPLNQSALDLFCEAFLFWRDLAGFDFVRHDSVDHIFDSIQDEDGDNPLSDRPTPYILSEFIRRSKLPHHPYVGHLAERMGNEIEDYQAIGYDLILGSDMMELVDRRHLEKSFQLQGQIELLNQRRKTPFSLTYAVDTHDTGNKHLWGMPLINKLGHQGILQKLFLSRFLSYGLSRRPKYEVMGLSDLSYGLYESNVTNTNIHWVGDEEFFQEYNDLEDLYQKLRPILETALLGELQIQDSWARWTLKSSKGEIQCCLSFEEGTPLPEVAPSKDQTPYLLGKQCLLLTRTP